MKQLILILALLFSAFSLSAKDIPESQVPAKVKEYLHGKYPGATNAEWEYKSKKGYYKVEFKVDGREVELEIYENGSLKELEEDLAIRDIPAFAIDHMNKNYPDGIILGGKKKIENGITMYDVGVKYQSSKGKSLHTNIYFDTQGKVIKRR